MKSMFYAGLALATFLAVSVRADYDEDDEYVPHIEYVKNMTDRTFEDITGAEDLMLVFFYSKGCGACKQMKPYFYNACKRLSEREDGAIPCAQIDCDAYPTTKAKANVMAYPTMKVMRNGHMMKWSGPTSRSEGMDDKIYDYMMDQMGSSSTEIETAGEVKEMFKKKNLKKPAVLGYFTTKTGIDYKYFIQVAHTFRDYFDFYHVSNTQTLEEVGYYGKGGSVTVYRPWGGKNWRVAYKGLIFKQRLNDFVLENMLPPVDMIEWDRLDLYNQLGKPLVRGLIWEDFADSMEEPMRNRLAPLQEKYGDELSFIIMGEGSHTKQNVKDLKDGGVITIIDADNKDKKFVYDAGLDGELDDWIKKFLNKELKVHVKSEPAPAKAAAGEVQVVTGNTFDLYVMDETKDVLIEFYAPWCGHCKRFAPVYDDLAKELKDEPNVLIAKIDQTANENNHKQYKAGGFPTLMWAKANDKANPVKYEGAREIEDIIAYIKENASVKLSMANDEL